jgi:hypothetical protein
LTDTLFSDVSEFQDPVNDSYPYRVLSIRSDDGIYRDHDFAQNYAWCCAAADAGRLDCFIVYAYWRPNWDATLATMRDMVGTPHPKMVVMIDLESGGNPGGDQSDGINRFYWGAADWLGDKRRVIGYGNVSDLDSMWPTKPEGIRLIVASYGSNPDYPGKIAHQFTDGQTDALFVPPFGNADVNSADGLTSQEFAAACGIGSEGAQSVADNRNEPLTVGWFEDFVKGFDGPIYQTAAAALKELTGSPIVGEFPGFEHELGGRTVVGFLGALGAKLGIEGCHDPKAVQG